jgi:hypothetical protein
VFYREAGRPGAPKLLVTDRRNRAGDDRHNEAT